MEKRIVNYGQYNTAGVGWNRGARRKKTEQKGEMRLFYDEETGDRKPQAETILVRWTVIKGRGEACAAAAGWSTMYSDDCNGESQMSRDALAVLRLCGGWCVMRHIWGYHWPDSERVSTCHGQDNAGVALILLACALPGTGTSTNKVKDGGVRCLHKGRVVWRHSI